MALDSRVDHAHRQAAADEGEQRLDLGGAERVRRVVSLDDRRGRGERVRLVQHGVRAADRRLVDDPGMKHVAEVDH